LLSIRILEEIEELRGITSEWDELLQRSAGNVPTLSPGWLLPWWDLFGPVDNRQLKALEFRDGQRLVGLAPLCLRRCSTGRYRGLRRIELLGSGEDEADAISSDYIGLIAESGAELPVAQSMAEMLAGSALGDWDDALFDSMNGSDLLPLLLAHEARALGMHVVAEMTSAAPHIVLPNNWDAYLASLTTHRRKSLKQNLHYFERWAGEDHQFRRAASPQDLDEGYRVLVDLHRARWSQSEQTGAFVSPRFLSFHETVMPWLLQKGALDLTWLCVRKQPVAVTYNIVWNGKLHFYQSGRSLDVPSNVQIGLVLQAHNIRAAIAAGLREYDFLGGISAYKMKLATATRPLMRVRIVPPSVRTNLLQVASVVRRQLRAVAAHPRSHPIAGRVMRAVLRRKHPTPET
jgi:CelD/BcsL family acetyltransferase involved in cellulose biosynthesis